MHLRIGLSLLAVVFVTQGAELQQQSVRAWDAYVNSAATNMQNRTQENATFLWVDESQERVARVRRGEILVSEAVARGRVKSPGALIHHWIGAAFIPGAQAEDVLAVIRDYPKYSEFYRPAVIHSETIQQESATDRFSILLMNKALVMKLAIAAECQASYHRLDDKRWYGESYSTKIQEIENFESLAEHRLPPGQGAGFIWRLHSFTRIQERDGGVYFEVEALALSRDVPASLRLFVEPIVKRVSRNSLLDSLQQTSSAVTGSTTAVAKSFRHEKAISSFHGGY